MKRIIINSKNDLETKEIANKIASKLFAGSLITLSGQLGAGKTTFTQGLAKGLHISKNVTSPTFTLLKIYQGDLPLYHIDAYRLEGLDQDLGFDEYIEGDGVTVIEWSNFIANILPQELLNVDFSINDDDSRTLTITAIGQRYEEIIKCIA